MTKTQIYNSKAHKIIKDSIKSVVYIDEKAWNPFENIYNGNIEEHIISKKLYENLKNDGINLNIHKFSPGDEDLPLDNPIKKYLFDDIDLVVLDWDLDSVALNTSALKLLDNIIVQPHIHFCCVYSSSPDFDSIIKKIESFFSGYSKEQLDMIRSIFEYNDDIIDIVKQVDINNPDGRFIGQIKKIDATIWDEITTTTNLTDKRSLIPMALSIKNDLPKSDTPLNYAYEIISQTGNEYTLIINNTIISLLKKRVNKPTQLIKNFSKHISQDRDKSFFKILGLDMQNEFSKKGAFINPEILNISLNTFMYHRKQMNSPSAKPAFNDFLKDLLLENAKLNLSNTSLKMLDDDFLDSFKPIAKHVKSENLALINCFYNGTKIDGNKFLSFGDILIDEDKNYYLCITALCDCIIRNNKSNIAFKYYFVKGQKLKLESAFKKGDGGFISFIDKDISINWNNDEYIKPFQLYIPEPEIQDSSLLAFDWLKKCPLSISLKYAFTLKQNYAQRIANHAFGHPVRVGVDFVKK
jgi:hypothetical protein